MMIYDKLSGFAYELKDSKNNANTEIIRNKEDKDSVCKALIIIREVDRIKQSV